MRLLLPALHELAHHYGSVAQFSIVYTMEAHAQDQWPISSGRWNNGRGPVIYDQPKSLEERLAVVTDFCSVFQPTIPIIVDTMSNEFERAYASWPLRLYVLHQGKMAFIAGANDWLPELSEAINKCIPTKDLPGPLTLKSPLPGYTPCMAA
jgi:hypothetical protein